MRKLLTLLQALLLAAGIVFAVLWYRHPHQDYDALLAISVAVFAALEFLKRMTVDDQEMKGLAEAVKQQTELLHSIRQQNQKPMQATAGAGSQTSQTPPAPGGKTAPAPADDPIERAVTRRSEVQQRLLQYAKLKKIGNLENVDTLDQARALELVDQLDIPATFKDGLRDFLEHTKDLVKEPVPLIAWAAELGKTLVDYLDMVIRNAGSK